jgi:Fe2+ or Zn2+ uptake regulation protein
MDYEMIDKIISILREGERLSIKELYEKLLERGEEVSPATVLKWVEVGIALGKIKEKDYGNVRIVWIEKEGKNGLEKD